MFRHEGPSRSPRKNAVLAAYLAAVAGFVNSGGVLVIGSFTSHVTGSMGRFANDVANRDLRAALLALFLVLAFFCGAVVASLIVELRVRTRPVAYGFALLAESALLFGFLIAAGYDRSTATHIHDLQAALLCCAMGMQNSLVTRLSGAVVRTTHLTGVITDLGIAAAHWLRWLRLRARARIGRGSVPPRHPPRAKSLLLLTIVWSFLVGSVAGASMTLRLQLWAMAVPAAAILCASAYAFISARAPAETTRRTRPSGRPSAAPRAADRGDR